MASRCFGSLLFSLFFVFSFTFHPFSHSPADPLYVFSSRQKNCRIDGLFCFRWRTLMSSLFTAFSSLHRFRDCLRLVWSFPLAWVKMNFPLYYPLFPLHGLFLPFSVYCSVIGILLSVCERLSLFSRILFSVRYVTALLQGSCFATFFA